MTFLETCISTPAAHALGWTIFHSLWQGAIAGLTVALALLLFRSPRARYTVACFALLAMVAAFAVTYSLMLSQYDAPSPTAAHLSGTRYLLPLPPVPDAPRTAADLLPWLAPFWIAGVVCFHLRSLAGWIAVRRLTRRGVCAAPDAWQRQLHRLSAQLRVLRPVALLESCLAEVPVVIGHLRPVILLPAGLLTGLPAGQVEAILLHELAHIRRYDYLLNLAQASVEAFFFYHPAAWWISSVIRSEREHCCDDLAVAASGDAHGYAIALAALEQNRSAVRQTALAATGGSLVKRIRRLIEPSEGPRASLTPAVSATVLALTAVLTLAAWQTKPAPPTQPMVKLQDAVQSPAGLPISPWDKWATEDVAYIMTNEERTAFFALQNRGEREHFIEQFWDRRNPTPGSSENPFKQEHYRRIAYANAHFSDGKLPGWKTDRGRVYIVYGPPDEIESHPSGGRYQRPAAEGGGVVDTYPFEQWRYRHIANIGDNVIVEFVDDDLSGAYHMTLDPNGKNAPAPISPLAIIANITGNELRITVPGARTGATLHIAGRIQNKASRREVQVFRETIADPSQVFLKSLALPAGTYQLKLLVSDGTARAIGGQDIDFEVK